MILRHLELYAGGLLAFFVILFFDIPAENLALGVLLGFAIFNTYDRDREANSGIIDVDQIEASIGGLRLHLENLESAIEMNESEVKS